MNSLILVSLILSVLLGIFRGIDLTFWTDAETGLCVVGPVWLFFSAVRVSGGIRRRTISAKGIDTAPKANSKRQSTVMIQRPTTDATTAPIAKLLKTKDAARARQLRPDPARRTHRRGIPGHRPQLC